MYTHEYFCGQTLHIKALFSPWKPEVSEAKFFYLSPAPPMFLGDVPGVPCIP